MASEPYLQILDLLIKDRHQLGHELSGLKDRLKWLGENGIPFECFGVQVDYDKTVEELISNISHRPLDYRYDYINSKINSKNFPSKEKGNKYIKIFILDFCRFLDKNEALREIDALGLRPATLKELLSAVYERSEFHIFRTTVMALGSIWHQSAPYAYHIHDHTHSSNLGLSLPSIYMKVVYAAVPKSETVL